jgi:TolA-binding protein
MSDRTLAGEVVVFAGKLMSMTRRQATELVRRLGGRPDQEVSARTTLLVVGADTAASPADGAFADTEAERKMRKARELQGRTPVQPLVIGEDDFCELAGRVPPSALRAHYYAIQTIRGLYPAIRDDHLRYLEKWGLLTAVVRTPGETYFGFGDLAVIRQAAAELEAGASFRTILRALAAAGQGQLSLDFRNGVTGSPGPSVVSLPSRPLRARPPGAPAAETENAMRPAERKFLTADRLDTGDEGDVGAAMTAYREALALDPSLVPALINLGNLHYARDALAEAAALYVQAALVDPDCFEAHFNLGNVHHDQGRYPMAAVCYEEAIRLNGRSAEAHFYLAVTLEKMGRSHEARPEWRRYLELAPDGEWVALAQEFSDG